MGEEATSIRAIARDSVDRMLAKGGKLHSKYHITLPEEFTAESVNGIY